MIQKKVVLMQQKEGADRNDPDDFRYRVKRIQNSTKPRVGQVLTEEEVDKLLEQGYEVEVKELE